MKCGYKSRIFFTFFVLSLMFSCWTSWNEQTNFDLIKSIVENSNFYLDDYQDTGDKLYLNGHYFALFFHWGFSFLLTWIYFLVRFFSTSRELLEFFLTILGSSIFFSLSGILAYSISKYFLKKRNHRILATLSYGFSTPLFQQSRVFTTHSMEAFFFLFSIFLFLRSFNRKDKKNKNFFPVLLIGIFIGYGLLLSPFFLLLGVTFFIFLLINKKWKYVLILITTAISVFMPFYLFYRFFVLKSIPQLISPTPPIMSPEEFKPMTFPLSTFFQLLFFPSKGILFYYPIFFFSFLGFVLGRYRTLSILSVFFIFSSLLSVSLLYSKWWSGWVSYGTSRVLTVLTPFLFLGLLLFIQKFGFKPLVPFLLISLLNNFLLLQYGEDKISTLSWEEYEHKMKHLEILSNPLIEHYLPLTFINGPRSVLLENLILKRKIDIGLRHPCNPIAPAFIPDYPIMERFEYPLFPIPKIGIVCLKLPWFPIFLIICFVTVTWKEKILNKFNKEMFLLLLVFTFFVFFYTSKDFYLRRWMVSTRE